MLGGSCSSRWCDVAKMGWVNLHWGGQWERIYKGPPFLKVIPHRLCCIHEVAAAHNICILLGLEPFLVNSFSYICACVLYYTISLAFLPTPQVFLHCNNTVL